VHGQSGADQKGQHGDVDLDPEAIREILTHLGEPVDPPRLAPARSPPLWEAAGEGGADLQAQPIPEYEFDQWIAW
jgi:hypothetical protein